MILAAAFFSRVRKVGKDGIELADVVDVIADTPAEPGDTADDLRAKLTTAVEGLPQQQRWPSDKDFGRIAPGRAAASFLAQSDRRLRMERDTRSANLLAAFGNWLAGDGWVISVEVGGSGFRTDLVATHEIDGRTEKLFADMRAAVVGLRPDDAYVIAMRRPPKMAAGDRRAVVFADGVAFIDDALDVLRESGLEVYIVNADTGDVTQVGGGGTPLRPRP